MISVCEPAHIPNKQYYEFQNFDLAKVSKNKNAAPTPVVPKTKTRLFCTKKRNREAFFLRNCTETDSMFR